MQTSRDRITGLYTLSHAKITLADKLKECDEHMNKLSMFYIVFPNASMLSVDALGKAIGELEKNHSGLSIDYVAYIAGSSFFAYFHHVGNAKNIPAMSVRSRIIEVISRSTDMEFEVIATTRQPMQNVNKHDYEAESEKILQYDLSNKIINLMNKYLK